MGSKRRSKKPVTLLTQIEGLLCDVLAGLSCVGKSVEKNVRDLLLTAEASVAKAKDLITPALAPAAPRKPVRARRRAPRKARSDR